MIFAAYTAVGTWFFFALESQFNWVIDAVALAAVLAGALLVARYRSALSISQAAADAWESERDAAVSKADRRDEEIVLLNRNINELTAKVAALEARPNLEGLQAVMIDHDRRMAEVGVQMVSMMEEHSKALRDIALAIKTSG